MKKGWLTLESASQLEEAVKASFSSPVVLFKHSTRCATSSLALRRLEQAAEPECESVACYFLDLIRFRSVSNQIADSFSVPHESPQVLVIRNGECIYEASHLEIQSEEIAEQIRMVA